MEVAIQPVSEETEFNSKKHQGKKSIQFYFNISPLHFKILNLICFLFLHFYQFISHWKAIGNPKQRLKSMFIANDRYKWLLVIDTNNQSHGKKLLKCRKELLKPTRFFSGDIEFSFFLFLNTFAWIKGNTIYSYFGKITAWKKGYGITITGSSLTPQFIYVYLKICKYR